MKLMLSVTCVVFMLLPCWGADVPVSKGWPCWRGPFGSGAAYDCGEAIVTNLADARLVWLSEERTYQAYPEGGRGPFIYTGEGGPVVVDGRVFYYFFMPDGKVFSPDAETIAGMDFDPTPLGFNDRAEVGRRHFSITADDVLLCADAKNGKTLWKRVIPGGINYGGRRGAWAGTKCGPILTPCAAYGKVYFAGSTLRVFCLDEKTGATVWESNLGEMHKRLVAARDEAIAAKTVWKLPINWFLGGHCPAFADGVVAFDDELGSVYGGGLIGFDAETGRELWHLPAGVNSYPGPVRWSWQGKEYFISGRGALIEPRTGKVIWGPFGDAMPIVVSGPHMLTGAVAGSWECRRISPEKAELLWQRKGQQYGAGMFVTPVVQKGRLIWTNNDKCYSMDLATGEKLLDAGGDRAGGRTSCSMIGTDGVVIRETLHPIHIRGDGGFASPIRTWGHTIPIPGGLTYVNSSTGAIDDGYWFFRCLDNLACIQLRRDLHVKVRTVANDVEKILGLCRDADPAVRVDAVEAIRRTGNVSAPAVEELVRLLDEPRYGACLLATTLLRTIHPPPPTLLETVKTSNGIRLLNALRSLSELKDLPTGALAVAATEPMFDRSEEARKLLVARCGDDLSPLVTMAGESDSPSLRDGVLNLIRSNLRAATKPGVISAVRGQMATSKPEAVAGLLQATALVGSSDAWAIIDDAMKNGKPEYRVSALRAMRNWPDAKPMEMLKAVVLTKEPTAVRRTAMESLLFLTARENARRPAKTCLDALTQFEKPTQELGLTAALLNAISEVKHPESIAYLGRHLADPELGEKAANWILACAKDMHVDHAVATATRLEIFAPKCLDVDARKEFESLAAKLRSKAETQAPSLDKAAGDLGGGSEL